MKCKLLQKAGLTRFRSENFQDFRFRLHCKPSNQPTPVKTKVEEARFGQGKEYSTLRSLVLFACFFSLRLYFIFLCFHLHFIVRKKKKKKKEKQKSSMFIELSAYFYIFSLLLSFVAIYLNFQFIVREKKMPSMFIELSACFSLFSFLLLFLSISISM